MRNFIILLLLIAVGYLGWKQYGENEPEQQRQPIPTPQASKPAKPQVAPDGMLLVTKQFSVRTETGIYGFPVGKYVSVVSREAGMITVSDGKIKTTTTEDHFTDILRGVSLPQEEKQKQKAEMAFISETHAQEPKPGDALYVTKRINVTTDSGLHGISVGKQVVLIRDDMTHYVIKDGDIEARAPKDSVTRNAESAKELQSNEQKKAAAAYQASQESLKKATAAASRAKLLSALKGDPTGLQEMKRIGAKEATIKVVRVKKSAVMADEMVTKAGRGSYMSSIGGGCVVASYQTESGNVYYYEGVSGIAEGDQLEAIVIEDGTYPAEDNYGGERIIKRFRVLAYQKPEN